MGMGLRKAAGGMGWSKCERDWSRAALVRVAVVEMQPFVAVRFSCARERSEVQVCELE